MQRPARSSKAEQAERDFCGQLAQVVDKECAEWVLDSQESERERGREGIYRYHSNPQVKLRFRRRARGHVSRERPHITDDRAAKFHVRVRVVVSLFVFMESRGEWRQ